MEFFEPSGSASPLTAMDEELLTGVQSDTRGYIEGYTVSELVVTALEQPGSYAADYIHLQYDPYSELDYSDYSWDRVREAVNAGLNAYTFASTPDAHRVVSYAQEAFERLYLASKSTQGPVAGPLGNIVSMGNLATLTLVGVHVTTHSYATPGITFAHHDGSAKVLIDHTRLDSYIGWFGVEKAINYMVYHELAHTLPMMRQYDSHPLREAITNEMGQVLAEIAGAVYPTDAELDRVGGWANR